VEQIEREFDLVSLVYSYQLRQDAQITFDRKDIEAIEEMLDGRVQISQAAGPTGIMRISLAARQMDLAIQPDRLEVRSLQPILSDAVATRIVELMAKGVAKAGDVQWNSIGHNYVLSLRASEGTAINHLKKVVLKNDLDTQLDCKVLGTSLGLWLEVDESRLRLRLDPSRDSLSTNRITVNANFSIPLEQAVLPEPDLTMSRLVNYGRKLDAILKGIGI
jgi:hypothetical protein